MNKKKWQKPELVIMVRTTPDEVVLTVCKGNNSAQSPAVNFSLCSLAGCDSPCSALAAS